MIEKQNSYIELFPSYWLYNAGLVGIMRTLGKYNAPFELTTQYLRIPLNEWDALIEYYIEYMEQLFGKNWFYGKVFVQSTKGGLFTNNKLINGLSSVHRLTILDDQSKWLSKTKFQFKSFSSQVGSWRFIQWVTYSLSKVSRDQIKPENKDKLENEIKEKIAEFNNDKLGLSKLEEEIYLWEDEKIVCFMKKILAYLAVLIPKEWEKIWDNKGFIKPEITNSTKIALKKRLAQTFDSKKREKIECCSFCGSREAGCDQFETKWFSYEGGSTAFKNFCWYGKTQLPICKKCQFVLYFSPLGIFPDSDVIKGEFINIPELENLWKLNKYRIDVSVERKEKIGRNALMESIISTGAYLKTKSRWLLQHVEIFEIGGSKQNTVNNLNILPVPLKLISSSKETPLVKWLTQIEGIQVKKTSKDPKMNFKSRYIYSAKYLSTKNMFPEGRALIQGFLEYKIDWLLKYAILLFKISMERNRNGPLNNFNKAITFSTKPLLQVILFLINKGASYSNCYPIGKSVSQCFGNADQFQTSALPQLFNAIVTYRKNDFLEIICRKYMNSSMEIDNKLVKILDYQDMEFQVEGLLLIIGVLENLQNKGENNGK